MEGDAVRLVDPATVDETSFVRRFVSCVILSHEGEIILQQRDGGFSRFPHRLSAFAGSVEKDETPVGALARELREALGAHADPANVVRLGVFTQALAGHRELIYGYFWHDVWGSITGCYEGKIAIYHSIAAALANPKITDEARWLLQECGRRELV